MEGVEKGIFGCDVNSGNQDGVEQEESPLEDCVHLSDNIFLFPSKNIGGHDNIFEGEMRSAVYGVRPCVIKFAALCEQNVREAEILTKLGSHTNVIAIIQSGTYCDVFEERVYIALDKCHNENLRQYLANRKKAGIEFDLNQAIDFAKQIIVGVMYIHDNNVIHLDLKPSNILISQNLQLIKIADFGLSIVVMSPKSKVFHKYQFGTNGYRPIESFGNGEVSMRTDIFSLGTVLLHLLSNGNDVFGCDEHTFIHNVMNDVTDTSGLLVSNPLTTEHLIKCMISKERRRRPNIWEVSDHPCWSGKEVDCKYEYFADDEIDDDATDTKTEALQEATSPTDIERDIAFLQRMREMGFNRKPTIVAFDNSSRHLYRIDYQNKSMTKMQEFPLNTSSQSRYHQVGICVVTIGEYIYIFQRDRTVFRLEYCDVMASWERMPNWIENERARFRNETDLFDCLAPSVNSIFLLRVTARPRLPDKGSVFEYNTSSSQWNRLPDKLKITRKSAIVRSKGYLYCIGGYDEKDNVTNMVERMNFETMEWIQLPKMKQKRVNPSAGECNEKIYVLGRPLATGFFSSNTYTEEKLSMEMYNPKVNQWTKLKSANEGLPYLRGIRFSFNVFAIEDNLYAVVRYGIIKYDVRKNTWITVMSYNENMQITRSVLVKMSS